MANVHKEVDGNKAMSPEDLFQLAFDSCATLLPLLQEQFRHTGWNIKPVQMEAIFGYMIRASCAMGAMIAQGVAQGADISELSKLQGEEKLIEWIRTNGLGIISKPGSN